jgi:hypothetical protein
MPKSFKNGHLEPLIFSIRGHRVLLDADLARLYGVDTKRFNETFKRNRRRFPHDFAFQLTGPEFANLRSQLATSSAQPHDFLRQNWSQFATSSNRGLRYLPWAFTEHGAANTAVLKRLAEIDKTLLQHDAALRDVYRKLLPLLQPPADSPKRRIGFHADD